MTCVVLLMCDTSYRSPQQDYSHQDFAAIPILSGLWSTNIVLVPKSF